MRCETAKEAAIAASQHVRSRSKNVLVIKFPCEKCGAEVSKDARAFSTLRAGLCGQCAVKV